MAETLITPDELTNFAPELDLSQYGTTTISGMIARASERVREYCQVDGFQERAVSTERNRVQINGSGELIISFERRPVSQGAVTALHLKTVDIDNTLALTSGSSDIYYIPEGGGYMVYPSNFLIAHGAGLISLRNANLFYEVSYTGGYAAIPETIKEAVTLFVREAVGRKSNPAGVQSFSQGSYSENRGASGLSAYIAEAKELLDSGGYVRRVA